MSQRVKLCRLYSDDFSEKMKWVYWQVEYGGRLNNHYIRKAHGTRGPYLLEADLIDHVLIRSFRTLRGARAWLNGSELESIVMDIG